MIQSFSKEQLKVIAGVFRFSLSRAESRVLVRGYLINVSRANRSFVKNVDVICGELRQHEKGTLSKLFSQAVSFRRNKEVVKWILRNLFLTVLLVFLLCLPVFTAFIISDISYSWYDWIIIFLSGNSMGYFVLFYIDSLGSFLENFNVKLGKTTTRVFKYLLMALLSCSLFYAVEMPDGRLKVVLVSVVSLIIIDIVYSLMAFFLSEILVDFYYYSKKIQITDALIIESTFHLSKLNWVEATKHRGKRQEAIDEIERLAKLLEFDWNSHISAGDFDTERYKNRTLSSIANRVRRYKRKLIIPSVESTKELEIAFKAIHRSILLQDFHSLIDEEVAAQRIKKKSKFVGLRSVLVSLIPLTAASCFKIFEVIDVNEKYIDIGLGLSILWFVISILLWMDPYLAEKISAIRSARDFVKVSDKD